jgi:hypothetical protein
VFDHPRRSHLSRYIRHVVVFDAADVDADSSFWAGMFEGRVFADDRYPRSWMQTESGSSVGDGSRCPFAGADDRDVPEGHRVDADPAGPFCIGWGHSDEAELRRFIETQTEP